MHTLFKRFPTQQILLKREFYAQFVPIYRSFGTSSVGVGGYEYKHTFRFCFPPPLSLSSYPLFILNYCNSNASIKDIAPFFSQIAAFRGNDLDGVTVNAFNVIDEEEREEPSIPQSPDFSSLQLIFRFSTVPQLRDRFLKVLLSL